MHFKIKLTDIIWATAKLVANFPSSAGCKATFPNSNPCSGPVNFPSEYQHKNK